MCPSQHTWPTWVPTWSNLQIDRNWAPLYSLHKTSPGSNVMNEATFCRKCTQQLVFCIFATFCCCSSSSNHLLPPYFASYPMYPMYPLTCILGSLYIFYFHPTCILLAFGRDLQLQVGEEGGGEKWGVAGTRLGGFKYDTQKLWSYLCGQFWNIENASQKFQKNHIFELIKQQYK